MWLSETQIKVWGRISFHITFLINQFSQGYFSRYLKKKAQGGVEPMETIQEDPDEDEEDDKLPEDEERAVEEALLEAQFMENIEAATENT